MQERTITCPDWCEFGHHMRLDPHRATIGTICAPGFEVELGVRQYAPVNGRAVTPPVQVVLTLDTTTAAGRPAGAHTVALPLPADMDVEAFLAESDHEPPPATTVVAPGITFEPYRRRPGGTAAQDHIAVDRKKVDRPGEDRRVTRARTVLGLTRTALEDDTGSYDATAAAAHLLGAVEGLLSVIDEREDTRS